MIFLFNMGLPMIVPAMYFMVLGMIPIDLIESLYIARRLKIRFSRTIAPVALANTLSTIVGIPLAWGVKFCVQVATGGLGAYGVKGFVGKLLAVTVQAPWLLPFGNDEQWMFHAAALFLLVPFFFATWCIEYLTMRSRLARELFDAGHAVDDPASADRSIRGAVRNANLISYGVLALLLLASLIYVSR